MSHVLAFLAGVIVTAAFYTGAIILFALRVARLVDRQRERVLGANTATVDPTATGRSDSYPEPRVLLFPNDARGPWN